MWLRLLGSISVFVVAGCEGTLDQRSAAEVAADEFLDGRARLDCSHAVACGWIGASEEDACIRSMRRQLDLQPIGGTTLGEALRKGRTRVDPVASAECVKRYDLFMSCAMVSSWCPEEFVGQLPHFSPCDHTIECADGWCEDEAYDGSCSDLRCKPIPSTGMPCGAGKCSPSDSCNDETRTCQPALDEGAPCLFQEGICRDGLVCTAQKTDGTDLRCSGLPVEGMRCGTGTAACDFGLRCDYRTMLCARQLEEGEDCDSPFDCRSGLHCAAVCVPWGDVGKPCGPDIPAKCPYDTECDELTRRCVPRRYSQPGDDCSETLLCTSWPWHDAPSLYCEDSTRTCKPSARLGEPCTMGAESSNGYYVNDPCVWARCSKNTQRCVAYCSE